MKMALLNEMLGRVPVAWSNKETQEKELGQIGSLKELLKMASSIVIHGDP